jgi:phospholipid/cholesterol/gamma-HCH transport system permease protein
MTEPLDGHGWRARLHEGSMVLSLSGDWIARNEAALAQAPEPLLERSDIQSILFDASNLGRWDSSLLIFLLSVCEVSRRRHIALDSSGLPAAARRLMALLPAEPQTAIGTLQRAGPVGRVGSWIIARWLDGIGFMTLVGEAALRTLPALRGKARMRAQDLLIGIHDAGIAALPMVALVNTLVGAIVAFVGGIQLRRLGAEIYVSNLIGVIVVREMAPLITAIVMSGRTGSAYAAEIAAMQGSGEIDALRALGVPIFDYLILPRVTALTVMMPLLATYAGALGMVGGFAVAVEMMHISAGVFVNHLRVAVAGPDIFLGLVKSVVFGAWIATTSCRIGLKAGRSATDVGHAATVAAVSGIVGVIALDALLDACANVLGI